MSVLIVLVHLAACIALIAIVLLQTGKGAEMGAAFGGASQTLFGGSGGSSFMSKITTGAAIVFMVTSLLLSYMYRPGASSSRSIMTEIPTQQTQQPPQQPQLPTVPEARPVQPEAPADVSPAKPGAGTNTKSPSAGEQSQQAPKKSDKAPAKNQ